ncbi:MAG: hypothetical protein LWX56_00640 [Ignavibacteria bacterium]|nr:hypothetical protein [Ignavibacteria bacterium]
MNEENIQIQGILCESCNAHLNIGDIFCSKCGAKQNDSEKTQLKPTENNSVPSIQNNLPLQDTPKSNKLKIGCISIAVLFFLFILLPLMCHHSSDRNDNSIDRQAKEELNQEKEQEREKYRQQEKENYELQKEAEVKQRKEELRKQGY